MVEAQSRVGGRLGAADGQVDTRVLVRTDKWYGSEKAWPIWSFVTRAKPGAIDRDLSLDPTNAEISTDVSNVQHGGVQLYVALIMLCTGRALDCAVSVMYSWSVEAWRMFCHACSLWDDAGLDVLMLEVLAILLDTKDAEVNLDARCIEMTKYHLDSTTVSKKTLYTEKPLPQEPLPKTTWSVSHVHYESGGKTAQHPLPQVMRPKSLRQFLEVLWKTSINKTMYRENLEKNINKLQLLTDVKEFGIIWESDEH